MENIPFGYNDDGKPDIKNVSGSQLGFRNFQTRKENESREREEFERNFKDFPKTPEEADILMNKLRKESNRINENVIRNYNSSK